MQSGLGLKIQWYFRNLYFWFTCWIGKAFSEKYFSKEYSVTNSLIVLKKIAKQVSFNIIIMSAKGANYY
jgi:hypothetical protein